MIQEFVLNEKEQWLIQEEYFSLMTGSSAFHILPLGTTRNIGSILGSISTQFSGNGRFTSAKGFGRSGNRQTGSKKNTCPFQKSKMMVMAHGKLLLAMSLNILIIISIYALFLCFIERCA